MMNFYCKGLASILQNFLFMNNLSNKIKLDRHKKGDHNLMWMQQSVFEMHHAVVF